MFSELSVEPRHHLVLAQLGRHSEAEPFYCIVAERCTVSCGFDATGTLNAVLCLAACVEMQSRHEDAKQLYHQTMPQAGARN